MLEAMEERQVTLGTETYHLESPFLVLATQNPIEHEGTYPLPEAQLDRFVLKLNIPYPDFNEEVQILRLAGSGTAIPVEKMLSRPDIEIIKQVAGEIYLDSRIEEYIVSLVQATREQGERDIGRFIEYGASPRASIYLYRCAKVNALLDGRAFVIPEDVKTVAVKVLRHRIVLTYEAESEEMPPDRIIEEIINTVDVP